LVGSPRSEKGAPNLARSPSDRLLGCSAPVASQIAHVADIGGRECANPLAPCISSHGDSRGQKLARHYKKMRRRRSIRGRRGSCRDFLLREAAERLTRRPRAGQSGTPPRRLSKFGFFVFSHGRVLQLTERATAARSAECRKSRLRSRRYLFCRGKHCDTSAAPFSDNRHGIACVCDVARDAL
jgi:hypothetical protein